MDIMRLCRRVENEWPEEKKETEYQQLLEDIKMQEFEDTLGQIRDMEFVADTTLIPVLYTYKANDFNENVKLAKEVAQEFRSGKLDPKMAMRIEKTTKQMLKRGMLIQ